MNKNLRVLWKDKNGGWGRKIHRKNHGRRVGGMIILTLVQGRDGKMEKGKKKKKRRKERSRESLAKLVALLCQ